MRLVSEGAIAHPEVPSLGAHTEQYTPVNDIINASVKGITNADLRKFSYRQDAGYQYAGIQGQHAPRSRRFNG
jgi:hypothetical protein